MTEEPAGFEPEPTNHQIIAVLRQLAEGQQELAAGQQALSEAMTASFAHLATEIASVKADVGEVRDGLAQAEARLTSRIGDVQGVMQSLKADVAAHTADSHGHPRAA